jgi:hypothetical protein
MPNAKSARRNGVVNITGIALQRALERAGFSEDLESNIVTRINRMRGALVVL